jgi:hypothetical protein
MGSKFSDVFLRINSSQTLTVASAGGSAVSTTLLGNQTYAIQLVATSLSSTAGSTGGVRIHIGNAAEAPVANSTSDTIVPTGFPIYFRITPGQQVSALGSDGGTYRLSVCELSG